MNEKFNPNLAATDIVDDDRDRRDACHRREFLAATGAVGVAAAITVPAQTTLGQPPTKEANQVVASQVVEGKDDRLLIHETDIAVMETPPELLTDQVTPLKLLFVRNNGQPADSATLAPAPLEGWTVELAGDGVRQTSVSATALTKMPQTTTEMVLQCCGNGRALFAETVKAKGTQWLRGGMGNVQVSGVRLGHLLKELGLEVDDAVRFVTAEGKDPPPPGKDPFEHSLPVDDAVRQAILVLEMNGQPIPAAHGGPLRLMTPGYYGTMHIKWLHRIRFDRDESNNKNHIPRYRTPDRPIEPGTPIQYTHDNSTACWRMKTKSVVLAPAPGAQVSGKEQMVVRGVAFNDGRAPIETVLVSVNRGRSWKRARLTIPESPYAWYRWECPVRLATGDQEVWARAVDSWGRTQPIDGSIAWNPSGYEWNGVEKIPVNVVS